MNFVDVFMVAALMVFAWSGWRQGFVAGLLSFTGFLVGGLGAALALPHVVETLHLPDLGAAIVLAVGILVCAVVGQTLASFVGKRLRSGIRWHGARVVDSVAGAALNVVAFSLVLWIVASAIGVLPDMALSREVRSSLLLTGIDRVVPDGARNMLAGLRGAVDASGLPRVFSGFGEYAGPEVPPPDAKLLRNQAVRAAWPSLVKVTGLACGSTIAGSGFVYASDHILTNAHVVAGMDSPSIRIPGDPNAYEGTVVALDTHIDLAVLYVPDLIAPPLRFAGRPAVTGDSAVVAGFPGGGDFVASPARIRAEISARGDDIYGRSGVVREVYSFRGQVVPGDSGGPLLTPSGRVFGVVFAADLGEADTGYAITSGQAADIAAAGRTATRAVDTGECRAA